MSPPLWCLRAEGCRRGPSLRRWGSEMTARRSTSATSGPACRRSMSFCVRRLIQTPTVVSIAILRSRTRFGTKYQPRPGTSTNGILNQLTFRNLHTSRTSAMPLSGKDIHGDGRWRFFLVFGNTDHSARRVRSRAILPRERTSWEKYDVRRLHSTSRRASQVRCAPWPMSGSEPDGSGGRRSR